MANAWWYSLDGKQQGPCGESEIASLVSKGTITPSTLVWAQGMATWQPLSEVDALSRLLAPSPPPLPSATPSAQPAPSPSTASPSKAPGPYAPPNSDPTRRSSPASPDLSYLDDPIAGPWRRFFARGIDLQIIGLPTSFAIAFVLATIHPPFGEWIQTKGSEWAFAILLFPVILALETVVFALFGNTLGKALLGVKLRSLAGERLTVSQYIERQARIYLGAYGLGIPLVSLFTLWGSYRNLTQQGSTAYDRGSYRVTAAPMSWLRWLGAILLIVSLLAINGALNVLPPQPSASPAYTPAPPTPTYSAPITWTNPTSARSVPLPEGVTHAPQANAEGQTIHVFSDSFTGATLIYGEEDVADQWSLDDYTDALTRALAPDMHLTPDTSVPSTLSTTTRTLTGSLVNDPSTPASVTTTRAGSKVARVVILGGHVSGALDPRLDRLREQLILSPH